MIQSVIVAAIGAGTSFSLPVTNPVNPLSSSLDDELYNALDWLSY